MTVQLFSTKKAFRKDLCCKIENRNLVVNFSIILCFKNDFACCIPEPEKYIKQLQKSNSYFSHSDLRNKTTNLHRSEKSSYNSSMLQAFYFTDKNSSVQWLFQDFTKNLFLKKKILKTKSNRMKTNNNATTKKNYDYFIHIIFT